LTLNLRLGGQSGNLDRRYRRLDRRFRCTEDKQRPATRTAVRTERGQQVLSQAVEDEYREVIFPPKFDRYVSIADRRRLLDIVIFAAERVEPREAVRECRDPHDDKYLALAHAGGTDVIVSSDDDLLVLHPWRGISILSPSDFLIATEVIE
jgi:uncharacterized protein